MLAALVGFAALAGDCSARCACLSDEGGRTLWQAHRAARRTTTSVETGLLDNEALDDTQTRVTASIGAMRRLVDACAQPGSAAACQAPAAMRRAGVCGCRAPRLLNVTVNVQRRLDDAAAGALFGDSEQNMAELALAMGRLVQTTERVAAELDRFGAGCPTAERRKRTDVPLRRHERVRMARRAGVEGVG